MFIFEQVQNFEPSNKELSSTFYPKIVTKLSEIQYRLGIQDPRSGEKKTYSGTRIQGSKMKKLKKAPDNGSEFATLVFFLVL
jgi:hypothetical protein